MYEELGTQLAQSPSDSKSKTKDDKKRYEKEEKERDKVWSSYNHIN